MFSAVQYNQIGTCVGGWKIKDITRTIKDMNNVKNIVVLAGTNDIVQVSCLLCNH